MVSTCDKGKKFDAGIKIGGKKSYLGTYDTAKEAAIAYDRAVLKANQSTTLLNFPDMVHNLDVEPKRKKYKRSSTGYRGVTKLTNGVVGLNFLFLTFWFDVKIMYHVRKV